MEFPHNRGGAGGLPRRRSRCSDSQLEPCFILELQEHVKGKCHLTHGLEGLDVDNFLHENRVLECNSNVVGVLVHRPKKRVPLDS